MAVESACRLYVILARDGRSAVVFRRGPSGRVCLLRWWLGSDTFEIGQWLIGRIYERRSDLSPDGDLLVYFAAVHKTPLASWTAVSRPPYLTALALWPKGDCWGGGGRFLSRHHVLINHSDDKLALADGFLLPSSVRVEPMGERAGAGEDNPICHDRMVRDGWVCTHPGQASAYRSSGPARWILDVSERYERVQPKPSSAGPRARLERRLVAVGVTDGPWYDERFSVLSADGSTLRDLGRCDWADWQSNGDLLIACEGRILRLSAAAAAQASAVPLAGARELIALAPMQFEAREAPGWARHWR
ncbi:MAG: hypothetical protein AB1749_04855 [Pseudomonadota bacterium]